MRSLAEEETVLPCHYAPAADVQVVQVTWYKETADVKEQIITAHNTNGQTGLLILLSFNPLLLWHSLGHAHLTQQTVFFFLALQVDLSPPLLQARRRACWQTLPTI